MREVDVLTLVNLLADGVGERGRGCPRTETSRASRDTVICHKPVRKLELVGEAAVGVRYGIGRGTVLTAVQAPRLASVIVHENVYRLVGGPTHAGEGDGRARRIVREIARDSCTAGRRSCPS